MFHTFDVRAVDRSNLSKAVQVMKALETLVVAENPSIILRKLNVTESRNKFAIAFNALCVSFSPSASLEEIDRRRYGDAHYTTFYDLIVKTKKRKVSELQDSMQIV
jgi:hypothetical protein